MSGEFAQVDTTGRTDALAKCANLFNIVLNSFRIVMNQIGISNKHKRENNTSQIRRNPVSDCDIFIFLLQWRSICNPAGRVPHKMAGSVVAKGRSHLSGFFVR